MMHKRLQPILDILDEGLRLYRRGFVGYVLLAASWLVPVAIGVGLVLALGDNWGSDATALIIIAALLLALPLAIYLLAAISRATLTLQQQQRIDLRAALRIGPLRVAGMGCYSLLFSIVVNTVTSMLGALICCPLYLAMIFAVGGIAGSFSDGFGAFIGAVLVVVGLLLFVLFYGLSLVISGASYSSMVYALQAFAQDNLPFGAAFQRSLDMTFYRFGNNLLAFVLASAIFSALAIVVTITIGLLLPLPLLWALGESSPVAQGVSASAWLLGLIVVLPPMPIWMTLLYQHNLAARQGSDLATQIADLAINLNQGDKELSL